MITGPEATMDKRTETGVTEPVRADGPVRKPYNAPSLRVYGDVAALTRTVGHKGTVADGGTGSKTKTS